MNHYRLTCAIVVTAIVTACNRGTPSRDANGVSSERPTAAATSTPLDQAEQQITPDQRSEVERLVSEGSAVMRGINSKYPTTEPCIGDGSWFLLVGVPEQAWSTLTSRQRVALSYYVESRVIFARESPARYTITPADAPIYSQFAAELRQSLCDTCWTIVTGPYSVDGGVSPDRALLNGDGCTRCWGHAPAASQLRKQTLSSALPPVTWMVGVPEGEPSCAGYVQRL